MQSTTAAGNLSSGRQAVVDRQHGAVCPVGEFPAHTIVALETADHPAPAVEINESRLSLASLRRTRAVQAHSHGTSGTGRAQITHFAHRHGVRLQRTTSVEVKPAGLEMADRLVGRPADLLDEIDDFLRTWI